MADAGPQVIHRFPETKDAVRGVTLLNDELYVLRDRDVDQADVYSTMDFTLRRCLTVPRLRGIDLQDVTSCEQKRCIYISDDGTGNTCVHRLGLDGSIRKWPVVRGSPWGLSVTRSFNLLVTCSDWSSENAIVIELSSDAGECVREITLESVVELPWHCVQLVSGQYLVCHGVLPNNSRVSVVSEDGRVVRSNVGDGGLRRPYHVAVDNDEFIFVAAAFHNRIVLYDTSLSYVRNVVEWMQNAPWILCFDDFTRRLYVGQSDAIVLVIQLQTPTL